MWKALVYKELRETAGIAAAGLIVYLWFATAAMGMQVLPFSSAQSQRIPFLDETVLSLFALISAALAVALAVRQLLGEARGGTWQFLLHRPVRREALWLVKMAVGGGLLLGVAALPLIMYAWWAATPGTHASPFLWSMTYPYWHIWLSMPIVYLGMFLSALRPARWFGTRLFPLAASGVLVAIVQFLPWWSLSGVPVLLLGGAALVGVTLHVGNTRDFS